MIGLSDTPHSRLAVSRAAMLIANMDLENLLDLREAAEPSQDWFPGRDYPDRDVWLAKRNTPRGQVYGKLIYAHSNEAGAKRAPLQFGINKAKRAARHVDASLGTPVQHGKIMKARAEYRAARYEANTAS